MSPDRVVVDTGVIMAVVAYRSKHLIPVFDKARNEDDLVISNIILMQCARQADKDKCELSRDEIIANVRELCPNVVGIAIVPLEELREHYMMRDDSDLEVLYSADMLDADILIASDRDFFDKKRPPRGIRARIMRPSDYLKRRRCINTEKPFDIMYRDDFRSPGRSTLQAEELGRAALCGTPADGDSPSRFSVLQEVLP